MRISRSGVFMLLLTALAMILASCGGEGNGGSALTRGGKGTTSVAGRVALSSVSSGAATKPTAGLKASADFQKAAEKARKADAQWKADAIMSSLKSTLNQDFTRIVSVSALDANQQYILSGATVQLFDAQHPEFIYPVAETLSDPDGYFMLDSMTYANQNNPFALTQTAIYNNGDPIPTGRYSLIASKFDANLGTLFVAVQAVVKKYEGPIEGNDLVAQDSDAQPEILTMFARNKDIKTGTYGSVTFEVAKDSAIQVTFSQAMARLSVIDAASVKDASGNEVSGQWKVAANLLSAAFYPASDLTFGGVYNLTINGGKTTSVKKTAKNVFGKSIIADVHGTFKAGPADPSRPEGHKVRPDSLYLMDTEGAPILDGSGDKIYPDYKNEGGNMVAKIIAPIRIVTNKPLDINNLTVDVSPSIGEVPGVLYVGYDPDKYSLGSPYVYDVLPSEPLMLNTTYLFTVDGASDLSGNQIIPFSFNFTTEKETAGVSNSAAVPDFIKAEQTRVKDVFGKWLRAFDDKSIPMLTAYMSGDFYWIPEGDGDDDLNRDGRMSFNEFTQMLGRMFSNLDACNSYVLGDVTSDIVITSSITNTPTTAAELDEASMSFKLEFQSENFSNPACQDSGPDQDLFVQLNKINGAWYLTRGADVTPVGGIVDLPNVMLIEAITPIENEELDQPFGGTATPSFKWTGIANTSLYAVILVDAEAPWDQPGWVALIEGEDTDEQQMKIRFNPTVGDYGDIHVLDVESTGLFRRQLDGIFPGGRYYWSVLAFDTLEYEDFKFGLFSDTRNITTDLLGAAPARIFTVEGRPLALDITIEDAYGKEFPFDKFLGGYDLVDSEAYPNGIDLVKLTIETPSNSQTAEIRHSGTNWNQYTVDFDSNGVAIMDLPLFYGSQWLEVCDGQYVWEEDPECGMECGGQDVCQGISKQFAILTEGGDPPVISIVSIIDNSTGTDLGDFDVWGNVYNSTVEYIDVTFTVNAQDVQDYYYNMENWEMNQWSGNWFPGNPPNMNPTYTIQDIPVYEGYNNINIQASAIDPMYGWWNYYYSHFAIEVAPGGGVQVSSGMIPDIPGATLLREEGKNIYYDAGIANTVNVDLGFMNTTAVNWGWLSVRYGDDINNWSSNPERLYGNINGAGMDEGSWYLNDPWTGMMHSSGSTVSDIPLDLVKGMNILYAEYCEMSQCYNRAIFIYTRGGVEIFKELDVNNIQVLYPATAALQMSWSDPNYVEYQSSADSIRISGLSIANSGTAVTNGIAFTHSSQGSGAVDFANVDIDGNFTFDVDLFNGWNYIDMQAKDINGNPVLDNNGWEVWYYVRVYTTGGTLPPQYVFIDSPSDGMIIPTFIPTTMFGHVDGNADNFIVDKYMDIYIEEFDKLNGNWVNSMGYTWYDNVYCSACLDSLSTFDPMTGIFTLPMTLDPNITYRIQAYAYGTNYNSHAHTIWVNKLAGGPLDQEWNIESHFKPGNDTSVTLDDGKHLADLIREKMTGFKSRN